ncbi:ABC transporter substrate-binding protein [Bradyrhizobium sp. RDM4]|uniref:ABC transporter substrate-binding protein n=1 Tax=Bradyrhizobium sp. RDM4 TaxID=3378765 RepID=UPI0038FC7334
MRRREFIGLIGVTAWPLVAIAQPAKVYRVGTLTPGPKLSSTTDRGAVLFNGLAKRGYVLGQNLIHEARGASGKLELVPQLMQELKAAGVDVVVTISYPAAAAAKASGVPTVLANGSGDPVKTGLVESLARPGGSVTGIADDASSLSTKRLSLLTALLPKLHRVAMLWNRDDLGMSMRYETSAQAAQGVGIIVQPLGVREPNDFNEAFEAMTRDPPDAILMVSDSLTLLNRKRVIDYAAAHRLPAIYEAESIVRDGGLMSYGADPGESFDRAAALVDLILKGAKPAELPVEEPTRYQFIVNLRTAKSIGLEIPAMLTALADEVIE